MHPFFLSLPDKIWINRKCGSRIYLQRAWNEEHGERKMGKGVVVDNSPSPENLGSILQFFSPKLLNGPSILLSLPTVNV